MGSPGHTRYRPSRLMLFVGMMMLVSTAIAVFAPAVPARAEPDGLAEPGGRIIVTSPARGAVYAAYPPGSYDLR